MPNTASATASQIAGRNIRAEMVRRGISQEAIAKLLDLSQAAVSSRLRGETRITVDEVVKIAAHLKVDPATLLDGVAA